jgi:hypothetical protein
MLFHRSAEQKHLSRTSRTHSAVMLGAAANAPDPPCASVQSVSLRLGAAEPLLPAAEGAPKSPPANGNDCGASLAQWPTGAAGEWPEAMAHREGAEAGRPSPSERRAARAARMEEAKAARAARQAEIQAFKDAGLSVPEELLHGSHKNSAPAEHAQKATAAKNKKLKTKGGKKAKQQAAQAHVAPKQQQSPPEHKCVSCGVVLQHSLPGKCA